MLEVRFWGWSFWRTTPRRFSSASADWKKFSTSGCWLRDKFGIDVWTCEWTITEVFLWMIWSLSLRIDIWRIIEVSRALPEATWMLVKVRSRTEIWIWFWMIVILSSRSWEEFCTWESMTTPSCPAKIQPLGDTIVGNDKIKTGADDDLNVLDRVVDDEVGSFSDLGFFFCEFC